MDEGSVKNFTDNISVQFLDQFVEAGHLKHDLVKPLGELKPEDYDVVFVPGGHGPMFDLALATNITGDFLAKAYKAGKIVSAVCHGPAALVSAKLSEDQPLVKGHEVACFTNDEEAAVKLDKYMPFALESKLRELGAHTVGGKPWEPLVVTSDRLITGQNPNSGTPVGKAIVKKLHAS